MRVGGQLRQLFLKQETADPDVAPVSLSAAVDTMRDALLNIAKLAKQAEKPKPPARRALDAPGAATWSLALDEIQAHAASSFARGCRTPDRATSRARGPRARSVRAAASPPLSSILQPIQLDALTVADDETFLERMAQQPNVPAEIRKGLSKSFF